MDAPRIDHIGILVENLETAAASIGRLLKGAPQSRRSLPEVGLEVVEFTTANVIIELLAYTDSGDGFGRAVMGSQMGVNHISLAVSDLDAALAALRADGVQPAPGFPREGAHGRIAFLPREPQTGLLFELCQSFPHEDRDEHSIP